MQPEFSEETRLGQGQYEMLLQRDRFGSTEEMIYFTLPGQNDYLYEYEGDLDEALSDLPEIYATSEVRAGALTPQALIVLEQLWDYFDLTGETSLQGNHEYDFHLQDNRLVVLPKDSSGEVFTIDRNGQIETNVGTKRYEHLMTCFALAHTQTHSLEHGLEHLRGIDH